MKIFDYSKPYELDKPCSAQVQSLLVKCPYVRYGCEWTGPLKEMQVVAKFMRSVPSSHREGCLQSHADSCQFCGVPCTNCDKKIAQSQLAEHLVECEKTCGKCTYCGVKVKTSNMEKHLKVTTLRSSTLFNYGKLANSDLSQDDRQLSVPVWFDR